MLSLKRYLKSPKLIFSAILLKLGGAIPERVYLRLLYRIKMGHRLNLKNPQRFTEKLQWLKLNYREPIMSQLVDKADSKIWVSEKIGEKYIIPTIAVWDSPMDIEWDKLPSQFVLKTTNGGGGTGVFVCKDKNKINRQEIVEQFKRAQKTTDIYRKLKEWPYKNVKPRIIAEKYMTDSKGELNDYKIYCFNGEPKVVMVATGRFTNLCFDYFDTDFKLLPFEQGGSNSGQKIEKPSNLDEMLGIAKKLSQGFPHVRVDLYDVDGHIYFGEMTFFDSSGFADFTPHEWNYKFGEWINLP